MAKPTKRVVIGKVEGEKGSMLVYALDEVVAEIGTMDGVQNISPLGGYRYTYLVIVSPLFEFEDVLRDVENLNKDAIPGVFREQLR